MAYAQFDRLSVDSIVEEFDMRVADGEAIAILGPAGCGKTRLLRAIAGFEAPRRGAISIGGTPIDALPLGSRGVAMVVEGFALYPHMTAAQNVEFPLRPGTGPADGRRDWLADLMAHLDLEPLRGRYPSELSATECLHVALARAMARRPRLLLLDDPLRDLRAESRAEMRRRLRVLQRGWQVTTVYATSDFADAMALGDRIAFVAGGRLHQVDTPAYLYVNPATAAVAAALGTPGINLLDARVEGGAVHIARQSVHLPEQMSAHCTDTKDVLVGIRPEDLDPSGDRRNSLVAVLDPSSRQSLGSYSIVRGQIADHEVIVQLPGNPSDIPRRAYAGANALLLFDHVTGERLR